MDIGGKYVGYGLGDVADGIKLLNHRLIYAYPARSNAVALGVTETPTFTAATEAATIALATFMNGDPGSQAAAKARGAVFPLRTDGVADLSLRRAFGAADPPAPPDPTCVVFSVNGAGSTWNMGYPFDIGETLDKSKCFHQPIGYNTNPFPMNTGVQDGVAELIRQLNMPRFSKGQNCTTLKWGMCIYSMGAIVGMIVLMRVLFGDLQQFKHTFMGYSAFGNPMRQHGNTFPGCSYSDGEGIVTPTAHDLGPESWDMACDKAMGNSLGDDLYTKMNKAGVDPQVTSNMRAVWDIVNKGNPLNLAEAIFQLLLHPTFSGGYHAAEAAWTALGFFVIKQTGPHVNYQFTDPLDGDGRDCWEFAREHMADLVARQPTPYA